MQVKDKRVAQHERLAGKYQMRILPEDGLGAVSRNARQRNTRPHALASARWWGPPEVEIRELEVYERAAA